METYRVELVKRAQCDLEGIYAYIAKTLLEPRTALSLVKEIEAQILSLDTMPYRYPERRKGAYANRGYRELLVGNYVIIYKINESERQVIVVAVRYARSNF